MTPEDPGAGAEQGRGLVGSAPRWARNREGAEVCPLRLFRWGDRSRKLRLGWFSL